MSEFKDFLKEQLQEPELKKEWNDIQLETDVIPFIKVIKASCGRYGNGYKVSFHS